eukprot:scaffold29110_cov62-Isochrysis_galbana.AAC.1
MAHLCLRPLLGAHLEERDQFILARLLNLVVELAGQIGRRRSILGRIGEGAAALEPEPAGLRVRGGIRGESIA